MVDDDPGYSRFVKPAGSVVPSAYVDVTTKRKIDVNDGVSMPVVAQKTGWAAGERIQYWDFGAGKRGTAPAYGLARCSGGQVAPVREHPVIVDSIPGDSDYSPYRSTQWACVTAAWKGEVIPSLDAFNDAIDLGLISDPTGTMATVWVNQPIVVDDVALALEGGNRAPLSAYYRGTTVAYHSLESHEGVFPYDGMPVQTGNVYEVVKPGSMAPARVIFSQPYRLPGSSERNPGYSPAWLVVTVTLNRQMGADAAAINAAYDAVLEKLTKESDMVTVGMNNALTVINPDIASAAATTNRVNRPFVVSSEAAP